MWLLFSNIFVCNTLILASNIDVKFLKAVNRLNTNQKNMTTYTDYYFFCNVLGRFIQWEYNNEPLSGFLTGDVGRVLVDERINYTYTATLLSSLTTDNSQAQLDSILVISFANGTHPNYLTVTCSSNINISYISTYARTMSDVENTGSEGNDVQLDYVLSYQIVRSRNNTHIFICGVRNTPQFVEVSGPALGFSNRDEVGQARTVFSEDRTVAVVQGVLISRESYLTATVIFVVENSDVNVTCYDRINRVVVPSVPNKRLSVVPDYNQTMPTIISQSTRSSEHTSESALNITLATLPLFFLLIIFVMTVYFYSFCKARRRQRVSQEKCWLSKKDLTNLVLGVHHDSFMRTTKKDDTDPFRNTLPLNGKSLKFSKLKSAVDSFKTLKNIHKQMYRLKPLLKRHLFVVHTKENNTSSTNGTPSVSSNGKQQNEGLEQTREELMESHFGGSSMEEQDVQSAANVFPEEETKIGNKSTGAGCILLTSRGSSQCLRNYFEEASQNSFRRHVPDITATEVTSGNFSKSILFSEKHKTMYLQEYDPITDDESSDMEDLVFAEDPDSIENEKLKHYVAAENGHEGILRHRLVSYSYASN